MFMILQARYLPMEMQMRFRNNMSIARDSLIIDPFSIDSVRYKYEKELTPEDIAGLERLTSTDNQHIFK